MDVFSVVPALVAILGMIGSLWTRHRVKQESLQTEQYKRLEQVEKDIASITTTLGHHAEDNREVQKNTKELSDQLTEVREDIAAVQAIVTKD